MRAVPRMAPLQHGQGHRWGPKPPVLVHKRRQDAGRTDEGRVVLRDEVLAAEIHLARLVEFCQKGCGPKKRQSPLSLPLSHAVLSGDGPSVGVIHRAQQRHALPIVVGVIGLPGLVFDQIALKVPRGEGPGVVPRVIHHLVHVLVGDIKHRIPRKRVVSSRHGSGQLPAPHEVAVGPIQHHRGRFLQTILGVAAARQEHVTAGEGQHVAKAVVILCTRRVGRVDLGGPSHLKGPIQAHSQGLPLGRTEGFKQGGISCKSAKHVASSPIWGDVQCDSRCGRSALGGRRRQGVHQSGLNVEVGRQLDHGGTAMAGVHGVAACDVPCAVLPHIHQLKITGS